MKFHISGIKANFPPPLLSDFSKTKGGGESFRSEIQKYKYWAASLLGFGVIFFHVITNKNYLYLPLLYYSVTPLYPTWRMGAGTHVNVRRIRLALHHTDFTFTMHLLCVYFTLFYFKFIFFVTFPHIYFTFTFTLTLPAPYFLW